MQNIAISIYSLFSNGSLLDDLIDQELILSLFWGSFGISFIISGIYYYVINSPRYSNLRHWLFTCMFNSTILGIIHFATCSSMSSKQTPRDPNAPAESITYFFDQGTSVFFMFAVGSFLFSIALFCAFSMAVKWWSPNARNTPM